MKSLLTTLINWRVDICRFEANPSQSF